MFCPKCGANQTEGRKFCTTCGTNLSLVSQALSGQIPTLPYPPYPIDPRAAEREQQAAKGLRMTVIGGIFTAIYFFCYILALPVRGGDVHGLLDILGFIGLIMAATGTAKLVNARPPFATSARQMPMPAPPVHSNPVQPPAALPNFAPQPIFSAPSPMSEGAPQTGGFAPPSRTPSALEDETQHLPEYAPPREAPK
jgi:hypothetical protein